MTNQGWILLANLRTHSTSTEHYRPFAADREWLFYGYEYGQMKFGNMPRPD